MIDTHTHYAHSRFDEDREAMLEKAFRTGVDAMINIAITYESNEQMNAMFAPHDNIFYAIGIHPCRISEEDCANVSHRLAGLHSFADWPKTVAIGETGLDYYREDDPDRQQIQRDWFRRHIELALEKKLPLVLHVRGEGAMEDVIRILDSYSLPEMPGVCHCFVGNPDEAEQLLNRGFLLGIGGQVTHRKMKDLRDSMKMIPMESILLETDCPFLAPAGHDSKRNSSDSLPLIVKVISQLKNVPEKTVIQMTNENAKKLFSRMKLEEQEG